MLFLCFTNIVKAQDFAPSQQAQGLLESKNVTVDYSTGIFHYKVPLYTLKSGDYELPISLDYTGKGVKVEDLSGLVGYNWTLNTGGVVTRTVRGGIADEDRLYGYLACEKSATPLKDDYVKVNQHKRDGESDIFTAVFGGKSVHFILRKKTNGQIYPQLMEQTNVKIECQGNLQIDGWIVTDEDGTRYTFRQKEWTIDLNKEDAISSNGIRETEYISSWYLTRIEPVNGTPITFTYKAEAGKYTSSGLMTTTRMYYQYMTKYTYKHPFRYHPFDFESYKTKFDSAIERAKSYIQEQTDLLQIKEQMYTYSLLGTWIENPDFDGTMEVVNQNRRILGMLSDFRQVKEVTSGAMELLDQLYNTYRTSNYNAAACFTEAKGYLTQSLQEVRYIEEKEVNNITSCKIYSPVLTEIHAEESVQLKYNSTNSRLTEIKRKDYLEQEVSGFRFAYSSGNLKSLKAYDKDGTNFSSLAFSYHTAPSGTILEHDQFGYPRRKASLQSEATLAYDFNMDEGYAHIGSLQSITLPDGGTIRIDYELNRDNSFIEVYGGIRLKSLIMENKDNTHADTLSYRYSKGEYIGLVYPYCFKQLPYGDYLQYSRIQYDSAPLLAPGNNGLYYRDVLETISGQGSRHFYYKLPYEIPEWSCPYWSSNLLDALLVRDVNGVAQEFTLYSYYVGSVPDPRDGYDIYGGYYGTPCDSISFSHFLPQMKADPYYMNESELESEYKSQPNLIILSQTYYRPYNDYYLVNIKPRIPQTSRHYSYQLAYGGTILPKGKKTFRFDGLNLIAEEDLGAYVNNPDNKPYSVTEYEYDNLPRNLNPTRVSVTDSKGNTRTTMLTRVADMSPASSAAISELKKKNILLPVVKSRTLLNNRLVEEKVVAYQTEKVEEQTYFGPSSVSTYVPESSVSTPEFLKNDASLYTYGEANYRTEKNIRYGFFAGNYLPVETQEKGTLTGMAYSDRHPWVLLKADGCETSSIFATDRECIDAHLPELALIERKAFLMEYARRFCQEQPLMDPSEWTDNFPDFPQSNDHAFGMLFMELLSHPEEWAFSEASVLEQERRLNALSTYWTYTLEDFLGIYEYLMFKYPQYSETIFRWSFTYEEHIRFCRMLLNEAFAEVEPGDQSLHELLHAFLPWVQDKTNTFGKVEIPAGCRTYELYTLSSGVADTLRYRITYQDGESDVMLAVAPGDGYRIQKFTIDLSAYPQASSIKLREALHSLCNVLVPTGTSFEACTYRTDGNLLCKFNQNGVMELYEYDSAGRLTGTRTHSGSLLKTQSYHTLNQ